MAVKYPISGGHEVLVDEEDVERLGRHHWRSLKPHRGKYVYAGWVSGFRRDGKRHQTTLYMHRFITDAPPGSIVDHINGDTLDNRKENLRVGTQSENVSNSALSREVKRLKKILDKHGIDY